MQLRILLILFTVYPLSIIILRNLINSQYCLKTIFDWIGWSDNFGVKTEKNQQDEIENDTKEQDRDVGENEGGKRDDEPSKPDS